MNTKSHALFQKMPLRGEITLSTGSAPVPYHVYNGHGLLVLGTCKADILQRRFADEDVHPVLTRAGKGILVLFICDFPNASHGPHTEFHITALSAPTVGEVVPDDPSAALAALGLRPDWGVLSLHLWNDDPDVVAYNTEYLGLEATQLQGGVIKTARKLCFDCRDMDGEAIVSGKVRIPKRSDAGLMWRIMRALGLRGVWHAGMNKVSQATVINRKSPVMPYNGRAQTFTAPDKVVVTAFDPEKDEIETASGPLAANGFTPHILQHLWPFRFVYLHPDDA